MKLQEEPAPEQQEQQRDTQPRGLAVLRVLRHSAMLRLWLAQVIYLSVQSAASYGMIVQMTDVTNSATLVSLVLIALTLPPFILGAPAGALVDRLDRRVVLWISNLCRALATGLFVLVLLFAPQQYYFIYLLALVFSLVGLFFTPAEGALIPTLVDEEELLPALSLYNLTLNVSQALGLLVLGPVTLNFLPTIIIPVGQTHQLTLTPVGTLFAVITILYLIAALLVRSIPKHRRAATHPPARETSEQQEPPEAAYIGQNLPGVADPPLSNWQQFLTDMHDGWRLVRGDSLLSDSLLQACFGSLMMMTIAGLATIFVERLLDLPVKDTALIFTPAGIGIVVGSLIIPVVVAHLGHTRTIIVGMIGMAIGIGMLPVAQHFAMLADPANWPHAPLFLLAVALLTTLVGFSLDFVMVPAQTQMQERSPDHMRGRVLALYQALFNGGSIPVLLFMGALADLVGIIVVLYLMAGICLAVAALSIWRTLSRKHSGGPQSGSFLRPGLNGRHTSRPPSGIDERARASDLTKGAPL